MTCDYQVKDGEPCGKPARRSIWQYRDGKRETHPACHRHLTTKRIEAVRAAGWYLSPVMA